MENNPKKNIGISLSILVALGVLSATIFLGRKPATPPAAPLFAQGDKGSGNSAASATTITTTTTTIPPADVPKNTAAAYKDGTYSATGSYMSPGGEDRLGVTVTLKSDTITAVSITQEPGDNTSARYQDKFASGYQQYVIGKNIAEVNLTKVSGSSLTPKGFNDALAQIKAQARA